ncbi:MAG: cupin domain-containing protein [Spirochaetota bacterium]
MSHNVFEKTSIGDLGATKRATLKDSLSLTGSEISFNTIPAGGETPFVHSHKRNEEVYLFIRGKGEFWIDGTVLPVEAGTAVRVSPEGKRCLRALEPLGYFCVQTDAGSLVQHTMSDGTIVEEKPVWN